MGSKPSVNSADLEKNMSPVDVWRGAEDPLARHYIVPWKVCQGEGRLLDLRWRSVDLSSEVQDPYPIQSHTINCSTAVDLADI